MTGARSTLEPARRLAASAEDAGSADDIAVAIGRHQLSDPRGGAR